MMFFWLLFLIPLVMWAMRPDTGMAGCAAGHAGHGGGTAAPGPQPIEIARQRLARGEITTSEYEEIRRLVG